MIRIFDNGINEGKLADMITAMAGTWGNEELTNGDDIMLGNIIVGFRYNVSSITGCPYNLPNGDEQWLTTMAIIAYSDGTSENKTFTETLSLSKQAKMVILITRNI